MRDAGIAAHVTVQFIVDQLVQQQFDFVQLR
jgi:hypothetical protein